MWERKNPNNDPQEDLPEEPGRTSDDYQRPSDAPSVTHELGSSFRSSLVSPGGDRNCHRVVAAGLGVLGEMTSLLPEAIRFTLPTQTYLILNLIFFGDCFLFCWVTIFNGIKSMVSLQANSISGVAVAAVAALIQSVALLLHPRASLRRASIPMQRWVTAALFLEYRGKIFAHQSIRHNFRALSHRRIKYAVQYFDDHNTALQMAKVVADTPAIAYQNKAGFLKHFLSFKL